MLLALGDVLTLMLLSFILPSAFLKQFALLAVTYAGGYPAIPSVVLGSTVVRPLVN